MKRLISAGFIALMATAAPALANDRPRDLSIDQRQHLLWQRIEQGWQHGELTRREYRQLRHDSREIERAQHYFASDGHLSRRERNDLHARLDHLAREVYREKHDSQRRYGSYNRDYYPASRR